MRKTLLEVVQEILSSMDSDEANSISDTIESYQVARLVRQTYYDIATDLALPERNGVFKLEAYEGSSDPSQPVILYVPSNAVRIDWIKYNYQDPDEDDHADYKDIRYMPFKDMFEMMAGLGNSEDDGIEEMTFQNSQDEDFQFIYRTDKMPEWYTSLGSRYIIMDSLDTSIEDTLQPSNTMCGGIIYPTFELEDDFEPELDPAEFSYFYNKCKTNCFAELKQQELPTAVGESRRQKTLINRRKHLLPNSPAVYNHNSRFGRK